MKEIKDWCETAFHNLPITLKMAVVFAGFMVVAMVWSGILWLGRKLLNDKPPNEDVKPDTESDYPSLTGRK